jgi:hypothetical protein
VGPLPHRQGAETAGRNLYLVMNWVEGEALDHWVLRHRGVDVSHALKLLLPVAVAIDTMHGGQLTGLVPVVHRDIKPANILIGHGGSVLVDFGLTKGLSIGHPVGRAGTPGYIAPEVVAGGGYTPAADRYAFGATVFFLLTGRHPSTATTVAELRQLLESAPVGGGVADELVDRVLAMLDPDPQRRPAALANWIAQLRQSSLDDEVMTVRLPPPAPARPHRGASWASGPAPSPVSGNGNGATNHRGSTAVPGSGPSGAPASGISSAGTEGSAATGGLDGGDAPRRRVAHRAVHRAPRHSRHRSVLTNRYALAAMLAVAIALVASDAGAVARSTSKPLARSALPATRGGGGGSTAIITETPGHGGNGVRGSNGLNATGGPSLGVLGSEASNQPPKPGASTTTVPGAPGCVKSYAPNCGPVTWNPPVINKALTVSFTWSPQHPLPGQQVTFNVILNDPDANNLQIDGAYYGDSSGLGAGASAAPGNATGPNCQNPHGTWPAPKATPGHLELQMIHTYTGPGSYPVHFTASSGQNNGPCGLPDPYASTATGSAQTVGVDQPPPPPSTTIPPDTTTSIPPDTTTSVASTGTPQNGGA